MIRVVVVFAGQPRTWEKTNGGLYEMFDRLGDVRYVYLSPDEPQFKQLDFNVSYGRVLYPNNCPDKEKAIRDQWSLLEYAARECQNLQCDWIIRCRPDLKVLKPMENLFDLVPDALYFPQHNNWGGLNDRFWFGPKTLMIESFRYYQSAEKHLRKALNLERLLSRHVILEKKIRVRRTRAILSPLRENGTIDPIVYREDRGDSKQKIEHEALHSDW